MPPGLFQFLAQLSFGKIGADAFKQLVGAAKAAEAGASDRVLVAASRCSSLFPARVLACRVFSDGVRSGGCVRPQQPRETECSSTFRSTTARYRPHVRVASLRPRTMLVLV